MSNTAHDVVRDQNRQAWEADRYELWVAAYGSPKAQATRLIADPHHPIRRIERHLAPIGGRRICSIQGSHGRIAVALALLGADCTVVDFSEPNRRYALDLADEAGVALDYRLSDVMSCGALGLSGFDAVIMEMGILHYHQDLAGFFTVMAGVAAPGAVLVLNEFHPVERKLFGATPAGDYFSPELVIGDVPDPTRSGRDLGQCAYRFWTLAEVISAVLATGWTVTAFEEYPADNDPRIPGSYTLTAIRVPQD